MSAYSGKVAQAAQFKGTEQYEAQLNATQADFFADGEEKPDADKK